MIFDRDFYPTPAEVINQMLAHVDVADKVILEPSAGSGNIVNALLAAGAKEVLTYEKQPELKKMIEGKSRFMGFDFLESTKDDLSFLDLIIMNPPFSRDEAHILHAWEVAPEGCTIIALCNSETVNNTYSRGRRTLSTLIRNYGDASMDLGDCFSTAERKTNVNVSLVKLFKPATSKGFDYEGLYMDVEEENSIEGMLPYNEVRATVSRYIAAVKCFDEFREIADNMNTYVSPLGLNEGFKFEFGYNNTVTTKEAFMKELQKKSWQHLFRKMDLNKYVTSGVMADINKFIETQSKYPFTMKNIYKMIQIIIGTRGETMNRALVEAFDKITMHYHENRYNVEGWKTNSHYLIGKKFILPWTTEVGYSGQLTFRYNGNANKMDDLHKALCFITGTQPTDPDRLDKDENPLPLQTLDMWAHRKNLDFGTWYEWGFFKIKGFKKGTLHCKFQDEKVWELFNRKVAEIKGFPLPEKI